MSSCSMTLRVARIRDEAEGIRSFELVARGGAALPAFSAGAHIEVATPGGVLRQYSLCNDPSDHHRYAIAVLREPSSRGGSASMHDAVREGDELRASEPRNLFPLAPDAAKSVLVAGGIGITPILSMARQLASAGADFELHYCTRSRERTAFHDELAASPFAGRVRFHFSGQGGRAEFAALLAGHEPGTHLYVCGPRLFTEAALAQARACGWPDEALHCEFFANSVQPGGNEDAFQVRLASSGRLVEVPPDKSVVQALEDAGVSIPVSCGEGICGTCLTRVLEGTPEHRDLFLSPAEQAANDQFTPCCSRSKGPLLVLDL